MDAQPALVHYVEPEVLGRRMQIYFSERQFRRLTYPALVESYGMEERCITLIKLTTEQVRLMRPGLRGVFERATSCKEDEDLFLFARPQKVNVTGMPLGMHEAGIVDLDKGILGRDGLFYVPARILASRS